MRQWITLVEALTPSWLSGEVYHGTARRNFDFHSVAYFTSDLQTARDHALMDASIDAGTPRIIRARLSIHNPAILNQIEMQDLHATPAIVQKLRAEGFDSAVYAGAGEVCVFDSDRIHVEEIIDVPQSVTDRDPARRSRLRRF